MDHSIWFVKKEREERKYATHQRKKGEYTSDAYRLPQFDGIKERKKERKKERSVYIRCLSSASI